MSKKLKVIFGIIFGIVSIAGAIGFYLTRKDKYAEVERREYYDI